MKKVLNWSFLMVFILGLSCSDDTSEKIDLSGPEITVVSDDTNYQPGETAIIIMDISSDAGLKEVQVGSNSITEFEDPYFVKDLTVDYVIPSDVEEGEHIVSIVAIDTQTPSKSTSTEVSLNISIEISCTDFDESSVITGEGKIALSDFTSEGSGVINQIIINSSNDSAEAGVANPKGCGLVMMFDKSVDEWDGWNGFRIILDEPFTAEEFTAFGRSGATYALKVDVLRTGKDESDNFPAEGIALYVNVGNVEKYGEHPAGRSQYLIGTLTRNNEWETITFRHNSANSNDIDPNVADNESDMMEVVPAGGLSADGGIYYFDNLRLEKTANQSGLAETICDFEMNEEALLNNGWTNVFDEDFSSDLGQWDVWNGGAYNNELQHYQESNLSVEQGNLLINARRETVTGTEDPYSENTKTFDFTSGRIESKVNFSAGIESPKIRMVARIKLPKGKGLWPAFWSYGEPWPTSGEIDILEARGGSPEEYHTNYFYGTNAGVNLVQNASAHIETDSDLSECFHIYEVIWEENKLTYFLDGNIVHETEGGYVDQLFGKEQRVVLNVAVGGDFFGGLNTSEIQEGTMTIDYVRVYATN